jgi:hypothetical protein
MVNTRGYAKINAMIGKEYSTQGKTLPPYGHLLEGNLLGLV